MNFQMIEDCQKSFLREILKQLGALFMVINCSSNFFIDKFLQERSQRTLERIQSLEMERRKISVTSLMTWQVYLISFFFKYLFNFKNSISILFAKKWFIRYKIKIFYFFAFCLRLFFLFRFSQYPIPDSSESSLHDQSGNPQGPGSWFSILPSTKSIFWTLISGSWICCSLGEEDMMMSDDSKCWSLKLKMTTTTYVRGVTYMIRNLRMFWNFRKFREIVGRNASSHTEAKAKSFEVEKKLRFSPFRH